MHIAPGCPTEPVRRPKVFGIGFHKTGTTSLAVALYSIGYDVCGYFGNDDPQIAEHAVDRAFALADRYDAAQDMPWPVLFRELDQRYPGSRFVLTVRPENPWIASVTGHFKRHRIPSHQWIYGVPTAVGHEAAYLARYRRHQTEVLDHFADRPGDLLVMDLGRGDGWDLLCPFLGLPVPDIPFPTQNTAAAKRRDVTARALRAARSRWRIHPTAASSPEEQPMTHAVSADTVRSMLHRHHQRFDDVIAVVIAAELSDRGPCDLRLSASLARLCCEQVTAELAIAERLGVPLGHWIPVPDDLAMTVERWQRLRTALRANLARHDDRSINRRTADGQPVWQVVLDLYDQGAERHTRMRLAIEHHGRDLPHRPLFDRERSARSIKPAASRLLQTVKAR